MALGGMTWKLAAFGGAGGSDAPIVGTEITLHFDDQDNRAGGSAGCNRYTGGFTEAGDRLTFSPLASTRMFCPFPDGIMEQEDRYLAALQQATRFEIQHGHLTIECGGDTLSFDAVP
jgi:heat shock protein HslJ